MFNYTFKIIYIVGCKSPQNALLAVINSKSVTKEVITILRKSINEPQYTKLVSKKQNGTIVTGFVWNNGKYEVAAYETIGKSGEPWYEVNANPIPEPKRQLILSTTLNEKIPKNAIVPTMNPVKNISKNILLDKTHVYELHNHPQRKSHAVNTFSDDDVVEFIREPNLKRSYIVGNDKTLFTLIKTKPIVFTKSLEKQLRLAFSFKNLDNIAIEIYNTNYALQYIKKSDTEARYKYETTIWEAFEKIAKKYGLKFVISKI